MRFKALPKIIMLTKLSLTGILIHGLTTNMLFAYGNSGQAVKSEIVFQNRNISGRVTNQEDGEPLIGVNIVELGSTNGTITDIDGKYSLNVAAGATLVFSSVGYVTEEVKVDNRSVINMTLTPDIRALEEIVVVGYGTMKESDITGSLSSVSSKDFEKQPLTRIDQALQGRATGVQVVQTGGDPGGEYKIRIRGANSISGGNNPLYVVDGQFVSDISTININDIQSMEILKDASATAIYGSMGANGVVLVTTKTGKRGETNISFDTYQGFGNVVRKLDLMSAAEFAEGVNFLEGKQVYTQDEIDSLRVNGGEEWQARLFKQARTTSHQLSLSGGSQSMDYFLSGGYYTNDGTIFGQDYKRYTLRANLNADLSGKIKLGFNASGTRAEKTGQRAKLDYGLTWDPTTPAYDENGDLIASPYKPGIGNTAQNVLIVPTFGLSDDYSNRVTANGNINYDILEGLTLNISGGLDWTNQSLDSYVPLVFDNIGKADVNRSDRTRFQNTNRLTYVFDKIDNHRLQIDAIYEQQKEVNQSTTASAEGFFSDKTAYRNLALGELQRTANLYRNRNLQSYIGRLNYSYKDRYLLTASIRADGSSKFRKGHQWGIFPSGSFGWRISEEEFFKNVDAINELKLRISYGVTGNQGVDALATRAIPLIRPNVNYPFTGAEATIGVAPSDQLANPLLTWESTAQTNIGLNLELWESKVTFAADAYRKYTWDLLLERNLPEFVGPTRVTENVGEVENKGIELSLNYTPVQKKDFSVTSGLYFNRNVNKVIALIDDQPMEKGNGYLDGMPVRPTWVKVGLPISSFRGYVFEGVYQLGEEEEALKYGRAPGDPKYKDVNKDGKLSVEDIALIGDGNPDFTMGWNSTVFWKRFDMNFLFTSSFGNDIYNLQRGRMMGLGANMYHPSHADFANRWTPENPSNIPASRDNVELMSSQFLEDGSFVALKNVSLSYTFGKNNAFDKIGLASLRIYSSIENAFILTKYRGFDPESTRSGNLDTDLGLDLNNYPLARTITIGAKVTF